MNAKIMRTLSLLLILSVNQLAAQTDFTNRLINPGFETGNYNGWTWVGQTGGWTTVNNDGDITKHGNYIGGYWNTNIVDVECFQTVNNLAEGYYQVSALATISTGRTSNQRLFANNKSMLYGAATHPAYTAENLAIIAQNETYSFGGYSESPAENGPFYPLKVVVHITDGILRTGFKFSGHGSTLGFEFKHTTRTDAGFFKFDHFTLTEVSDVATLDRIDLSAGILNEAFSSNRYHYTATVPQGLSAVTPKISATVEGVQISGVKTVDLSSGSGSSEITVTALDGSTQKTYTIEYQVVSSQMNGQQNKLYHDQFPLGDVKLLDGPFKHAMELNIQHMLKYDVDRLLAPYRKEAGLPAKASSYPNWIKLDGHIGGHYLSALAIHYAATGDTTCLRLMNYMVNELHSCQLAHTANSPLWGRGYAGGIPYSTNIWSNFIINNMSEFNSAWVPWYNLHKTYAGLRDAWLYGNNTIAKQVFLNFCDWGIDITSQLTDAQIETMLGVEYGGMNETFADAYQMTGDTKYLTAARRFSHKFLLNSMATKVDNLNNLHANTQVPKVVGFQRVAELAKDPVYQQASEFFWQSVTKNRSLSFGGNSRREHFTALSGSIELIHDVEGPESCNTHNMLKLTENLFRVQPQAEYADYYERALFNHILSTQHPQHGGYVYFTPARPQHYRVYSSPNQAMWCCVGTGMENHGKYGEFIYTHQGDSLYINLFLASQLEWKQKGIRVTQSTTFPEEEKTKLTISTDAPANFVLKIRSPYWVEAGSVKVSINGSKLDLTSEPQSYISINRTWNNGDIVEVELPMHTRIESLPNVPQYVAIMYGPILLGAKTDALNLDGLVADDSRWGHIANGPQRALDKAPILVGHRDSIALGIKKINNESLKFSAESLFVTTKDSALVLEPFYKIHDSRYMMYWLNLENEQYQSYLDSLSAIEEVEMILEARTVDRVATGEQQPEIDHKMKILNSNTGIHMNEYWRDARNGGYFSYELETKSLPNLSLLVRYWGNESGNRSFNILIDNQLLVTENITGKWNKNEFVNIEYAIPNALIEGKEIITVKFQGINTNHFAGGVFYLRLLKPSTPSSLQYIFSDTGINAIVTNRTLTINNIKSPGQIFIYDCSGRIIHKSPITHTDTSIPLQFSGVHIVRILNTQGISQFKCMIK